MEILLIGGTGVLSGAVAKEALRRDYSVTVINRGKRPVAKGLNLIKADRTDYDYIKSQLNGRKFDAIIDFLCYNEKDLKDSFSLYNHYTNQYFFISSCAVYDTSKGDVCKEDSPKVLPVWPYSVNKWACECLLQEMAAKTECNYTVIRPCVTYGDTRIPYGISPVYGFHWTLCARVLAGKPLIRWNKGINKCNMTRVEDFSVGLVGLIGNKKAYNEAFNICGEETPSFNDVLAILEKELNCTIPVVDVTSEFYAKELPSRAGEILGGRSIDAINSNEKIKSIVPEFKQTISLKDGIAKTISAYKEQNYQRGIDWHFDAECDRIIKKWCKQNRITTKGMNLKFVDYLGNATLNDKIKYYMACYERNVIFKVARKLKSAVRYVLKHIKH